MRYKISRSDILRNVKSIPGWSSRKKLVIIESDDWGSLRISSKDSFSKLEKSGLDLRSADAERYNLNDTLASSNDLESLYEVLSSVKDKYGKAAVFTPAAIMANPDFQKIKESGFREYFFEPFTETLKRIPGCENSFALWKEGIENKLFVPQMHGREHLNVIAWMKALQEEDAKTRIAFEEEMWGFVPDTYPAVDYQAAFLLSDLSEMDYQRTVIREGLLLFEELLGYKAVFFVPPNGFLNSALNRTLAENGIKYRFASNIQNEPIGEGKAKRVFHYNGQKEKNGVRYVIRNCFFEPSQAGKDWVDTCLNEIKTAFYWHKPAIISSHRVNYIAAINPSNRDKGLQQLSGLLKEIVKKWPDVEFITTSRLGALMNKEE